MNLWVQPCIKYFFWEECWLYKRAGLVSTFEQYTLLVFRRKPDLCWYCVIAWQVSEVLEPFLDLSLPIVESKVGHLYIFFSYLWSPASNLKHYWQEGMKSLIYKYKKLKFCISEYFIVSAQKMLYLLQQHLRYEWVGNCQRCILLKIAQMYTQNKYAPRYNVWAWCIFLRIQSFCTDATKCDYFLLLANWSDSYSIMNTLVFDNQRGLF